MADTLVIEASLRGPSTWPTGATHSYHATIAADPVVWGVGNTIELAVEDLARSHPEHFVCTRITVVYNLYANR